MDLNQRREWIRTFAELARWLGSDPEAIAKLRNSELNLLIECYAVPGERGIIDTIGDSGLTDCLGETQAQVLVRHPLAVRQLYFDWCKEKARAQNAPVTWLEVSQKTYNDMLDVLPPLDWQHGERGGFLVSEPVDHHMVSGRPRYDGFVQRGCKYYRTSRPVTRLEFRTLKDSVRHV